MLPFDLTWLEPFHRRSFRERFDYLKRGVNNALTALAMSRVISVTWLAPYRARFFLANGAFVAFDFCEGSVQSNTPVGLISSVSNDSFLCEQLASLFHEASDALLSSDFALLVTGTTTQGKTFNQATSRNSAYQQIEQSDHNLYFVYFGRRHVGGGCEQLSELDPHIQVLPLSGDNNATHVSHATKRKVSQPHASQTITPGRSDRLRMVMNSSQDLFAIWWTSHSTSTLGSELNTETAEEGVRAATHSDGVLLFRLNTASCLLNPLAALAPAPGQQFLLISFSNTAACELFAVEWCKKEQHQLCYVVIALTTYLIDQEELVPLDSAPLLIPDKSRQLFPSLGALSPRDDRLLIANHNGHLFLINVRANVVASSTSRFTNGIASIAWHPTGCLFAVLDFVGKLYLVDLGLTALNLFQLQNEASTLSSTMVSPFVCIGDFDANSKNSIYLPLLSWNPDESRSGTLKMDKIEPDARRNSTSSANNGMMIVIWAALKGMGLFRLMLPHPPTSSYLIRHWLALARSDVDPSRKRGKHNLDQALTAAVAIVSALDFDIDGEQAVRCVASTATALLRQRPMDALIDGLLDKCLACFCNPTAPISDVTKLEFGPAISQILRRRALHLLRHGKLETAFDIAANQLPKPATDLLADTFYAALERGELALAKAAYARARRQVAAAVAAVEVPQVGQRRQEGDDEEDKIHSF